MCRITTILLLFFTITNADSLLPESEKQKVTKEVIAPLKFNRELFKDDKSYEKYLESFWKVKGHVLGLVERCTDCEKSFGEVKGQVQRCTDLEKRCTDCEKKCEDLKRSEADAVIEKKIFERMKYCNVYRRQIDRFENIFWKPETYIQITTFGECLDLMLPIYAEERKLNNQTIIDSSKQKASLFREELTRIEKWRLIILWIFLPSIAKPNQTNNCYNFKPELEKIVSFAEKNKDRIQFEYDKIKISATLEAVYVLRGFFLNNMKMGASNDIYEMVMLEMKMMAKSFHDGYQICSEELEKIQNLTATPDDYNEILVQINPTDVDNDVLVRRCLDMMVEVGRSLRTSRVKSPGK